MLLIMVVFAPWFTVHDPYTGSVLRRLKPVGTPGHWLGTDEVGRDLWSRMVYGGRLSLLAGVVPVFLALLIGGFLGVLAGYAGGLVNSAIMRLTDVLYAFPSILLAIAITGILGAGLQNTILALTISFIPPVIRISESVTTQVRHLDFVEAARASGARPLTIMRYHILNNVLGPILVYATSLISICIILAAGLSFLGLGVTPPSAEWGLMLNNLRQALWVIAAGRGPAGSHDLHHLDVLQSDERRPAPGHGRAAVSGAKGQLHGGGLSGRCRRQARRPAGGADACVRATRPLAGGREPDQAFPAQGRAAEPDQGRRAGRRRRVLRCRGPARPSASSASPAAASRRRPGC